MQEQLEKNYDIKIDNISKINESSDGNVFLINIGTKKLIMKKYDDINHANAMVELHKDMENKKINAPRVVKNNSNNYITIIDKHYCVLYTYIKGQMISELYEKLPNEIIYKIGRLLRKIHDSFPDNNYNINNIDFEKNNLRKSILHFDLTKSNMYKSNDEIYIIDFDDSKYGPCIIDVAIAISFLFISKKNGIDKDGISYFLKSYYENSIEKEELKYIKKYALKWIDVITNNNIFNPSTTESFEIKRKYIEEIDDEIFLKLLGE